MEQDRYEGRGRSAPEEFPRLLSNTKVKERVHNDAQLDAVLRKTKFAP
jgi:hypothetical protein